jgi:hypothetical protein
MTSRSTPELELEQLQHENAELREQAIALEGMLREVSTNLGEEVHSLSMSVGGGGNLRREAEKLAAADELRAENTTLVKVMEQMALELESSTAPGAPPAWTGSTSETRESAELGLLQRRLQQQAADHALDRQRAAATEAALRQRVVELEGMLGEAMSDVDTALNVSATVSQLLVRQTDTEVGGAPHPGLVPPRSDSLLRLR